MASKIDISQRVSRENRILNKQKSMNKVKETFKTKKSFRTTKTSNYVFSVVFRVPRRGSGEFGTDRSSDRRHGKGAQSLKLSN